jgi:hypothetical protein
MKCAADCITGLPEKEGIMKRGRRVPFVLFAVCLVAAMPYAWGQVGLEDATLEPSASLVGVKIDVLKVGVTLCHIPPGDPANAQTIVVGESAVREHLAHGDYLGECHSACGGMTCTASDQCHDIGTCDPATGACSNPNAADGTACDDGNAATANDQCTNGVCGGTVICAGVPSAVPKTGQTECWDENGNPIDCAGTGQDGELQTGSSVVPRFTDNLDGTVTDNLTGLIWLKHANCFGTRTWNDALSVSNNLASGACGLTDGSVAGDWRLPNRKEWESLIDFGQSSPALPPGYPFEVYFFDHYWSSTTVAYDPYSAWNVELYVGNFAGNYLKASMFAVWPVRGGQ